MNWTKPSEDLAVSVAQGDDNMTNFEKLKSMSLEGLALFVCENQIECADSNDVCGIKDVLFIESMNGDSYIVLATE